MEIFVSRFLQLLIEENQHQNLVSRQTSREDLDLHVKDSLEILQKLSIAGQRIVDIGSGAGFPGLVLAMAEPNCCMTLVESDLKKSDFLREAVTALQIPNVQVIRARVENLGQDSHHRDAYDLCTSRAVAGMRILLEYGLPLVKPRARLFMWKGSNYQQEVFEAQAALETLGGQVADVYPYTLINNQDRAIVVVEKIHPTPPQYPRKVGTPAKRPL